MIKATTSTACIMASSLHLFTPLLLLFGSCFLCVISSSASPIYYEKPSLARLTTATSKQAYKDCVYNRHKYLSGEEVKTDQPCLKCRCKRGVLLCALRVCPPVIVPPQNQSGHCQVIREANACCPILQCGNTNETESHATGVGNNVKSVTTTVSTPLLALDSSVFIAHHTNEQNNSMVSVEQQPLRNTTLVQTMSLLHFPNTTITQSEWDNPQPSSQTSTLDNSTKSYQTDLDEMVKSENGVSAESGINLKNLPQLYTIRDQLWLNNEADLWSETSRDTSSERTTTSNGENVSVRLRMKDCTLEGISYRIGDLMPSEGNCTQCFCAQNSTRLCQKIQCALYTDVDHHCVAVIPEGHCCPIEYKCERNSVNVTNITTSQKNDDSGSKSSSMNNINNQTSIEILAVNSKQSRLQQYEPSSDISMVSENSHPKNNETLEVEARSNMGDHNSNTVQMSTPKLENVASFLQNIFHAFGFAVNDDTNQRLNDHSDIKIDQYASQYESSQMQPSFFTENVDRSVPKQQNTADRITPVANGQVQMQQSFSEAQIVRDQPQPEALKLSKDLVNAKSQVGEHFVNNLPLQANSAGTSKAHMFSNGWRAVTSSKDKPSKQTNLIRLPVSFPKESTNSVSVTTLPSTTSTTYIPKLTSTTESNGDKVAKEEVNLSKNSTSGVDINKTKCIVDGVEYENGATLPQLADPCQYCSCFYGTQICQKQTCPDPPNSGCVAEHVFKQCCPVYTCGITSNNTSESSVTRNNNLTNTVIETQSPIRKAPQYQTELSEISSTNMGKVAHGTNAQDSTVVNHMNRNKNKIIPAANQPRISFPFDPLPRPLDLIYGARLDNRVHFPAHGQHSQHPQHLPPGIVFSQNGPNSHPILNLNKPFLNRPLYPPNANSHKISKPHVYPHPQLQSHTPGPQNPQNQQPHQHHAQSPPMVQPSNTRQDSNSVKINDYSSRGGGSSGNGNSPIRPLPQSPMQLDRQPATVTTNEEPKTKPETVSSLPKEHSPNETFNKEPTVSNTEPPSGLWDIFQVSGCNIYGKMYKTGEEIVQLSNECKKCICSSHGVQCKEVC